MLKVRLATLLLAAIPAMAQGLANAPESSLDTAILNGRVIDPESRLDGVRNVGLRDGRVVVMTTQPLKAKTVIDAKGLVVAPGFMDLHSHGQTPENYRFKARDGVTTALELEVGVWPLSAWYAQRSGQALINYGASSGHIPAAIHVMHDSGTLLPKDRAVERAPSADEEREILADVKQGLEEGGLGVGMGLAYMPKLPRQQVFDTFRLAGQYAVPCFVHVRNAGPVEPGFVDGIQEVMADAAASGAPLHVVHITSVGLRDTAVGLEMIHGARDRHMDVTTEAYPYSAGMTDISSAIFDTGWQAKQGGITFHDLQWAATGERLTPETFAKYRKTGGMVAVHSIPEDVIRLALADPIVMIASDGILDDGKGHPRAAGTFARVLGRYVREEHVLTLPDAIRRMTLLPANRINMRNKGRVQVGADADLTIFDPDTVADRATFENPAQYSVGMRWVFVNGVAVVSNGELVESAFPGRGVVRTNASPHAPAATR